MEAVPKGENQNRNRTEDPRALSHSDFQLPASIPPNFHSAVETGQMRLLKKIYFKGFRSKNLERDNYRERFQLGLWFEETSRHKNKWDLCNVQLIKLDGKTDHYKFSCPAMFTFRPRLNVQDTFKVFKMNNLNASKFQGAITELLDGEVKCVIHESDSFELTESLLRMQFNIRRTNFIRCHCAVQDAIRLRFDKEFLFPDKNIVKAPRLYEVDDPKKLHWFNAKLNVEQKNAVLEILAGRSRPLPYIIMGPPGTGKTSVLIEAVQQVHHADQHSRILVCAPVNTVADAIAKYLFRTRWYSPGDFVRLNGFLRTEETLDDTLYPFYATGEDISKMSQRIIICTCMTAGQLVEDGRQRYFTHVFVDEAGYCTEPEAMIPTTLLNIPKGGQLILTGDPHQLGPDIMNENARDLGLNTSLLARLMSLPLYRRQPSVFPATAYNPRLVTQLVKPYKTHPFLVTLASKIFYNRDLIPQADEKNYGALELCYRSNLKDILVSVGVPFVFDDVTNVPIKFSESLREWHNCEEANKIADYVNELVFKCDVNPEDIGIISILSRQVVEIKFALSMKYRHIKMPKIGVTQDFLRDTRKVIIMSTGIPLFDSMDEPFTRMLDDTSSYQEINTMVTRARALLIVVGNHKAIVKNKYWRRIIRFAVASHAYRSLRSPTAPGAPLSVTENTLIEPGVNSQGITEDLGHQNEETDNCSDEEEFYDCVEYQNENKFCAIL